MTTEYSKPDALEKLGSGSADARVWEQFPPTPEVLERFPNPMLHSRHPSPNPIQLGGYDDPQEFTSLCPKTGQPDHARIVVVYQPGEHCVESKSWKLYLQSFRQHGEFHESCVQRIKDDLIDLLDPIWIEVTGEFTPRGGISINPTAKWDRSMKDVPADVMIGKAPRPVPGEKRPTVDPDLEFPQ
jgi:7-cyano-7-deazaguanine reductase